MEKKTILENIADITNPKITTVIEFDSASLFTMGGVLIGVVLIGVVAWAMGRKLSNS